MQQRPGQVRDAVLAYLQDLDVAASIAEIQTAVNDRLGCVSPSSVRSCLNHHTDTLFERIARGRYKVRRNGFADGQPQRTISVPCYVYQRSALYLDDCFEWLARAERNSIHAVVTDPPYGGPEYTDKELQKLKNGVGGVWRVPPSFDGNKRSPLPRFTVLTREDIERLRSLFERLGSALFRVLVPGANVVVASNPLLAHLVTSSLAVSGLQPRGTLVRLVMTMRGGDRPKNAHDQFPDVSVLPRSMWEPWVILRKPPEGRIQDNLKKWGTGGFRRLSERQPFGDVIRSRPTHKAERKLAPHPSLKPQSFLREIVRAALPMGRGVVLDPFAGAGSTLAAANAVGYESAGIEHKKEYVEMAIRAIPLLSAFRS
jgi:DNA modification methylase